MAILRRAKAIGRRPQRAAGVLALCAALGAGGAEDSSPERPRARGSLPEYVSKAGFLYNFAKYVEWPAAAFESAAAPIAIGIVGTDPFGADLEKALKGKTVRDRAFTIQRFRDPAGIRPCHILFVPRSEKARLGEILKQVESWPVLVVGEEDDFCRAGGTINILIDNEKPRLEVNPDAADKACLSISSKLLKVATIRKTGS